MSDGISDLKPVHLIYGSEDLKLEQAVERLKARLSKVADLDFNFETFDAASAPAEEVVNAANTMPFMSERRLVVVRNVDAYDKAGLEVLANYAEDPAPDTVLVLVARKPSARLVQAARTQGRVDEYKAPRRAEYAGEVIKIFGALGKAVGRDAAEALVAAVGRDLRRLTIEAEKVSSFVGEARTITLEDVERVMSETAPTSVFEFLDAVGSRDLRASLRLLSRVLSDGEAVEAVHAMAVRHVRNLLGARAVLDRRGGQSVVAREIGVPDWQAGKLVRQANLWTAKELTDALVAAARGEGEMKTSRGDSRLVFERWLAATVTPERVARA